MTLLLDLNCYHIEKDVVELQPNKGLLGKQFKRDAKAVMDTLAAMEPDDVAKVEAALSASG